MTVVAYRGRGERRERRPSAKFEFDDSAHGPTLCEHIGRARAAFIEDPLSFPWDSLDPRTVTPLIVDVSTCSEDDLAALRPALDVLGANDTIVTGDPQQAGRRLALALGVRTTEPTSDELSQLRERKLFDRSQSDAITRWGQSYQLGFFDETAVNEAVGTGPWPGPTWVDVSDSRDAAVVVRVDRSTVTSERTGFATIARRLVSAVEGTTVLGLSGVRSHAGTPVRAALVLIDQPSPPHR